MTFIQAPKGTAVYPARLTAVGAGADVSFVQLWFWFLIRLTSLRIAR